MKTGFSNLTGWRISFGVFLFLFVVLSQISGCVKKEPLQLGFVGGLSGRVADLGIGGRNGAMLAVEQRNAAGGVGGRPVRLRVRDDAQDPEMARNAVRELIHAGVTAIVGHMTSSMSVASVPLVNERKIVMVSPTTTTDYLSGQDDYFFRVSATTRQYASKMARYVRKELALENVTFLYDLRNRAYTESWIENFRDEFEKSGGHIRKTASFESGPDVHLYDLVVRTLSPDTDGLGIVANAMDTAMLCQQIRKLNRRIPVFVSAWAATEKLATLGGIAVEDVIVEQFFDRNSTKPSYLAFRDAYRNRFGSDPGFASVNAYDATSLLLDAIAKRKKTETLKEALLALSSFQGVQGSIHLNAYGDSDRETFLSTVENGVYKALE